MRAVSSHHDNKMRVLILSTILSCAFAAPSGEVLAPAVVAAAPIPTVNPGDLQAALIDAKVKTEDYIQTINDKNREIFEKIVDQHNEKVIEATDLAKERSLEAFWAAQDQKWQTIDALKTAEAQLNGQLADSQARAQITPVAIPQAQITPAAPVAIPQFYTYRAVIPTYSYISAPGVIAPLNKLEKTEEQKEEKNEEKKEEPKPEKEESKDTVAVEAANVKTGDAAKTEGATDSKYVVGKSQLLAGPIAFTPLTHGPWVASQAFVPELKTFAVPYNGHLVGPTFFRW